MGDGPDAGGSCINSSPCPSTASPTHSAGQGGGLFVLLFLPWTMGALSF